MTLSRQQAYIVVVGAVALLIFVGTPLTPIADPLALVIFCALVAAAEWTTSTLLEGHITISISTAVGFAAALIFAPVHAGLVGAIGGATAAASTMRRKAFDRRRAIEVLTFNVGMHALATFVGALVYQSLRGGPLATALAIGDLPYLLLAAVLDDQVNALALVVMIAIQSGRQPFAIWRENFAWAAPMSVATMAIGGGALAIGFRALGYTGLVVFFLPVALSAYAFRAYITRTQAVMASLEETVKARTIDLAEANQRLLDMHAQKDAFFAVITHDMRSPLTSLLGYTDLLGRMDLIDSEGKPFLAAVKRNTETLIRMVNDILDLAKLDSGQMDYKWEPVNMTEIVSGVLGDLEGHALAQSIQLECRIHDTPLLVGDEEKLRRVITNLVSNAIKYTQNGGNVSVELGRADGHIKLAVRDTGIGIPADQLPHIFERFRRVRRPGKKDAMGTGLGLAIVQEFVQAHGGRVEVESHEGAGSTFSVFLPISFEPLPVKP